MINIINMKLLTILQQIIRKYKMSQIDQEESYRKNRGSSQKIILTKQIQIDPLSQQNTSIIGKRNSETLMPIYLQNPFEEQQLIQQTQSTKANIQSYKSTEQKIKVNGNNIKLKSKVNTQYINNVQSINKNSLNYTQLRKQNEKLYIILNNFQQRLNRLQQTNKILINENSHIINLYNKLQIKYKQQCNKYQQIYKKSQKLLKNSIQNAQKYQQQNIAMINKIGDKCQIQQNRMMRIMDIIQKLQDGNINTNQMKQKQFNKIDETLGQLLQQTKIEKKIKKVSIKSINSILNTGRIQNLNLPPVTLKPVPIQHTSVSATYYMIDINEKLTNLTYIGQNGVWTHLLARNSIDPTKIVQFVYKIKYSSSNNISVGIIDKKYNKIRACKKQPNCIFYYGGSGRLWQSGIKLQKMGTGFIQGDIVIMIVLLNQGVIRWYVNGRLQAQYNSSQAFKFGKFKDIQWVPFVNMCMTQDVIIWQVGE